MIRRRGVDSAIECCWGKVWRSGLPIRWICSWSDKLSEVFSIYPIRLDFNALISGTIESPGLVPISKKLLDDFCITLIKILKAVTQRLAGRR